MILTADLIPVCEGGRWGYLGRGGAMTIQPRFTFAAPFRNGLARVNEGGQPGRSANDVAGGKWGFIDPSGAYAFAARFDDASDFSEGLAAVNLGARVKYAAHDDMYCVDGGKWGFIDRTGALAIPIKFGFVNSFRSGLAPARDSGRNGFLRGDGQWEIEPRFAGAAPFHEGLAAVQVGKDYGYIDRSGAIRVQPRFDLAYDFHGGLAAGLLRDTFQWVFFDGEGRERFIAPEGTAHVGNLSEGRIMANLCRLERYSDGRIYPHGLRRSLGYLNERGEWAIPPQFSWGGGFQEGLAWVKRDEGPYAYIRPDGSFLSTPELEEANSFDLGLAAVRINGKFALLDLDGKVFWSEA